MHIKQCQPLFSKSFFRAVGQDTVIHFSATRGCPCHLSATGDLRFLIMADQNDKGDFIANLILPWRNTDKVSGFVLNESFLSIL